MLPSAANVLSLDIDFGRERNLKLGVVGPHPASHEAAFEVRAFFPSPNGMAEDPVTGSLNAGLAQRLVGAGLAPPRYIASQGTKLGRRGRVHVASDGATFWIGGDVAPCIDGSVRL